MKRKDLFSLWQNPDVGHRDSEMTCVSFPVYDAAQDDNCQSLRIDGLYSPAEAGDHEASLQSRSEHRSRGKLFSWFTRLSFVDDNWPRYNQYKRSSKAP